ncbi:MAG: hypothetical protein JWP66_1217 [Naasia sp.]|nr:hypothetical protein [Naasia sp.]
MATATPGEFSRIDLLREHVPAPVRAHSAPADRPVRLRGDGSASLRRIGGGLLGATLLLELVGIGTLFLG